MVALPLPSAPPGALSRRALLTGVATAPLVACAPLRARAAAVPPPATVFVAGATGETGSRTVRALVRAGYAVRAGVRSRDKAEALGLASLPGVTIVDADLLTQPAALATAIGAATAVVCAAGARPGPFDDAAARVDEEGTIRLIQAASAVDVSRFILLSSILTNGAAVAPFAPAYLFLQLFSGSVLTHKLAAEKALAASGLDWGVLRPGGLTSDAAADVGGAVLARGDTFLGSAKDPGTRVSRDTVADVLVAMVQAPALPGVVELVASPTIPGDVDLGQALAGL